MTDLTQIVAGWPLTLSMAAAVAAQSLRAGRRRLALNQALHELRRPLQAVALASGPATAAPGDDGQRPIELAATALERLDQEINGGAASPDWGALEAAALVQSAVDRWQLRATLAQAALEVRWNAGDVLVSGDRHALGQALDNLIVNAIEHGGSTIVVSGRLCAGRVRIAVADSGRATRLPSRQSRAVGAIARLSGQRRHGHGLSVVQRVAADHGGRFAFRRSERGSLAALELPIDRPESGEVA